MRISDWSSDVCSSDLLVDTPEAAGVPGRPFDDHTARPKHAATLGGSHDEKCGPVLYRLTGVHEFGLDENVATGRIRHAAEPDQRRVAERRSDERRVGKECVSTCRSRGSPVD